jgi:hypothetical protein
MPFGQILCSGARKEWQCKINAAAFPAQWQNRAAQGRWYEHVHGQTPDRLGPAVASGDDR